MRRATHEWCNHHHTGWHRGYDVQVYDVQNLPRKHSNASPIRKSYSSQSRAHLAASTEWVLMKAVCVNQFHVSLWTSIAASHYIQPPLGRGGACCCCQPLFQCLRKEETVAVWVNYFQPLPSLVLVCSLLHTYWLYVLHTENCSDSVLKNSLLSF